MRRQRPNRISRAERDELNRQLKDAVYVVLVRPSRSEFNSPIIFIIKAYGCLRMYPDYRGPSEITRKDAYPLPRVDDTLDEFKDANIYTHLDLAYRYWQVRVMAKDAHNTAFQTPHGLMEWVGMPFGLCNTQATFQRMMIDVFDTFCTSSLMCTSMTYAFKVVHLRNAWSICVLFYNALRRRVFSCVL
jgi:hypothetical protein